MKIIKKPLIFVSAAATLPLLGSCSSLTSPSPYRQAIEAQNTSQERQLANLSKLERPAFVSCDNPSAKSKNGGSSPANALQSLRNFLYIARNANQTLWNSLYPNYAEELPLAAEIPNLNIAPESPLDTKITSMLSGKNFPQDSRLVFSQQTDGNFILARQVPNSNSLLSKLTVKPIVDSTGMITEQRVVIEEPDTSLPQFETTRTWEQRGCRPIEQTAYTASPIDPVPVASFFQGTTEQTHGALKNTLEAITSGKITNPSNTFGNWYLYTQKEQRNILSIIQGMKPKNTSLTLTNYYDSTSTNVKFTVFEVKSTNSNGQSLFFVQENDSKGNPVGKPRVTLFNPYKRAKAYMGNLN